MADGSSPAPSNGAGATTARRFTPRNALRLAPDAAERQGRITRLTISILGASDAILFLNSQHDALDDRPLALATSSDDGLQAVLRVLERP